jgi:hypothetical protein
MESPLCLRAFALILSCAALAAPVSAASPAFSAEPPRLIDAAVRGQVIDAAGAAERAEVVRFGNAVAPELVGTAPEESVRIAGWPVAPGERADVLLTRHEVYATGATIYKIEGGRRTEVPRSRLAFFWGTAEGDGDTRVFVSVDPDTDKLDGFAMSPRGAHEIHPLSAAKLRTATTPEAQYMVAPPETFLEQAGETPAWSCGTGDGAGALGALLDEQAAPSKAGDLPRSITTAAITTLHTAVLAIDTDNELLSIKFANNTTTATNYIASLIAQMNVMYQRDLLIQLVQGTTFLRVGVNNDPWTQPSTGGANGDQLNEVSNYWNTTNNGIARAFVAMLSGKGGSGASGIAWVPGALCSHFSGTSFSQVFTSGTTPSFGDALVVGHEIGHNFGSPHSHCYSPPIDNCYNGEAANGCYSGAQSCPAPSTINGVTNVTGTLMSYCHLLGGGCGSSLVFHPRSVTLLQPRIQAAVGQCVFPTVTTPSINTITPASGPISGGTAVVINGSGFLAGATVQIGGVAASGVTVVNSTRINAITPAHATGPVSVQVSNPGGPSATKTNAFFYAPPPTASSFYRVAPCRVLDTRNANGPLGGPALGASAQRTFPVGNACGVPIGATAVAVNVTTILPAATGSLTIFPGNAFNLGTSVLNFKAGDTRANNAILYLSTDGLGTIGIQNLSSGTTHVTVDVVGYFD